MLNNNKTPPRCSIAIINGRVTVIDHHNKDRHIEPACGIDAMAWHAFLRSQIPHSPTYERLAEDLLSDIADGKTPVSDLINRVRDAIHPAKRISPAM